jgi:hypothetical protein
MNDKDFKIDTKVFINGKSDTIELTVIKLGNKYHHFDNPKYRYIREKNLIQRKDRSNWSEHYTRPFKSPQDAEYWLEGKMQLLAL